MRKVAALVQLHAQDLLSQFHVCKIDRHVRLGTRVGLDICMLCPEELLEPVAGQILGHVVELASAIVPLAGIAFGIFIGHDRSHCFEYRTGNNVL